MSNPDALMHSNALVQDTKAEYISEYNLPATSKFLAYTLEFT